jgi:hypothetical protein
MTPILTDPNHIKILYAKDGDHDLYVRVGLAPPSAQKSRINTGTVFTIECLDQDAVKLAALRTAALQQSRLVTSRLQVISKERAPGFAQDESAGPELRTLKLQSTSLEELAHFIGTRTNTPDGAVLNWFKDKLKNLGHVQSTARAAG